MNERKWQSVHREIQMLSMGLSFTFLSLVWFFLGAVKLHIYGIEGWGYHWRVTPTGWDNLKAFWELHVRASVFWMALGYAADYFCWPYFLRKENKLAFHYDD